MTLVAPTPPLIKLDDRYKLVDSFERLVRNGAPSLVGCRSLRVDGPVVFEGACTFKGDVVVKNSAEEERALASGSYEDTEVAL